MLKSSKNTFVEIAISRAISAGWEPGRQYSKNDWRTVVTFADFWRYLGRHEGWVEKEYVQSVGKIFPGRARKLIKRQDWKSKMVLCMKHLSEELSIESYFKYLLK